MKDVSCADVPWSFLPSPVFFCAAAPSPALLRMSRSRRPSCGASTCANPSTKHQQADLIAMFGTHPSKIGRRRELSDMSAGKHTRDVVAENLTYGDEKSRAASGFRALHNLFAHLSVRVHIQLKKKRLTWLPRSDDLIQRAG